ncbi:MAG: class I SAM-dependent methyltransferase, partial [Patescibacteria group bacterium]
LRDKLFSNALKIVNTGKPKILEIGGGGGSALAQFLQKGADVYDADISAGMINEAKKIAPKAHFFLMDMRKLDFADGFFHGIWADGCVYHVPKKDFPEVLAGMFRVLAKGGVLSFNFKIGVGEGMDQNPRSFGGAPRYYAYYSIQGMVDLMRQARFKAIKIIEWPKEILGEKIVQVLTKRP